MPRHTLPQHEGEFSSFLTPTPLRGKVRNDPCEAVLGNVLVEHDKVVEDPHHRQHH
jgi:hypothetical protein